MNIQESTVLSQILGSGVFVSQTAMGSGDIASIPESLRLVNVSSKRQKEFYAGRLAAARALRSLGEENTTLPVGEGRAPIWPRGIVGSIAHDDETAVAAVARIADVAGIGIDIERLDRFSVALTERIAGRAELDVWRHWDDRKITSPGVAVFSFKESIFKCIFPLLGKYFDFRDIEIYRMDSDLRARPTNKNQELSNLVSKVRGNVQEVRGKMLSGCVLLN